MNLDMQVNIDVKDKKYDGTLRDVVQINAGDLMNEFCEHPSKYAWFGALSEICSSEFETKEFALDVLKANLDEEKRIKFKEENTKVTEAVIQSAIITDKRYGVMMEELIELRRQHGILKSIVKSLEHRATMLVQIGSMKRQEMMTGDMGISSPKVRGAN